MKLEVFSPTSDPGVTRQFLLRGKACCSAILDRASSREYLNKGPGSWSEADVVKLFLGGSEFLKLWLRHINRALPHESQVALPEMLRFLRVMVYRWWCASPDGAGSLMHFSEEDWKTIRSFSLGTDL